jgi:hypothetical protein
MKATAAAPAAAAPTKLAPVSLLEEPPELDAVADAAAEVEEAEAVEAWEVVGLAEEAISMTLPLAVCAAVFIIDVATTLLPKELVSFEGKALFPLIANGCE